MSFGEAAGRAPPNAARNDTKEKRGSRSKPRSRVGAFDRPTRSQTRLTRPSRANVPREKRSGRCFQYVKGQRFDSLSFWGESPRSVQPTLATVSRVLIVCAASRCCSIARAVLGRAVNSVEQLLGRWCSAQCAALSQWGRRRDHFECHSLIRNFLMVALPELPSCVLPRLPTWDA